MHKNHSRTTARTKRGKRSRPQGGLRTGHSTARARPLATADEYDVRLRYVHSDRLYNAASGGASKEFIPNGAYDVDPSVGSTETGGFDEYSLLYSYYRVTGYTYHCEFVNRETDALAVYLFNTNTAISGTSYDVLAGNPYCHVGQIGQYSGGGARKVFHGRVSCAKLLGSVAAETSDSMRATTTTNPTDTLHLTVAVQSDSGIGSLAYGVSYVLTITMNIRFYGRRPDLTIAATEARIAEIRQSRQAYNLEKQKKALTAGPSPAPPKSH